jgi:hypothetical protein
MKIRSIAIVLATAGTLLATAASASASTASSHVYHAGKCHASGQDALCFTPDRTARAPVNMHAHLDASPSQYVEVQWNIDCQTRDGGFASSDGDVTRKAPFRVKVKLPVGHPVSCDIDGNAELMGSSPNGFDGSGYVSLRFTYHRR